MTIKKKTAKNATKRAKAHPLSAYDPEQHAYILRCCDKDLRSHGGFQWPGQGLVEAPNWNPKAECGQGLHGWLWGEGDVSASGSTHEDPESIWIVARVMKSEIVELGGKVKFPRAWVEFVGTREAAVDRMCELAGSGRAIIYSTATAGDLGTATAGYAGTATAGIRGTATAGYAGTATAGIRGTATAGYAGTATAGYAGLVVIWWWDDAEERCRLAVGYVGEDGIEPDVAYVVRDGKLARKDGTP